MRFFNFIFTLVSMVFAFFGAQSKRAFSFGLATLGLLLTGNLTPAKADLATTLGTVETAATAGVDTVSTSVANVYISVFGLILLGVGIAWLFGAIKKR